MNDTTAAVTALGELANYLRDDDGCCQACGSDKEPARKSETHGALCPLRIIADEVERLTATCAGERIEEIAAKYLYIMLSHGDGSRDAGGPPAGWACEIVTGNDWGAVCEEGFDTAHAALDSASARAALILTSPPDPTEPDDE